MNPRRHTHEAVDQLFSRISTYLNAHDAWTLSALVEAVKASFTPAPNITELKQCLDTQPYYNSFLPRAINLHNLTRPHQFVIKKDLIAPGEVKSAIVCRMWSDTAETPACHLLLGVPGHVPSCKGGRPLFYSLDGNNEDFKKRFRQFEEHLYQVFEIFKFSDEVRLEWSDTLEWIRELQDAEASGYDEFWPVETADVTEYCQQHSNRINLYRHMVSSVAELPVGLQTRLPAEILALAEKIERLRTELADNIDFQGIFVGGDDAELDVGHRQVYDARKGNLVVLDNCLDKEDQVGLLGEWEKSVSVAYVRERIYPEGFTAQQKRREDPEALELCLCEPWAINVQIGDPLMPLWLFRDMMKSKFGKEISTEWKDVRKLPWKEIQAIPMSVFEACYKESFVLSSRTLDKDFMGLGVEAVVRLDLQRNNKKCRSLVHTQPYGQLHYTCTLEDKDEREKGTFLPDDGLKRIELSMLQVNMQKQLEVLRQSNQS